MPHSMPPRSARPNPFASNDVGRPRPSPASEPAFARRPGPESVHVSPTASREDVHLRKLHH